MRVAGTSLSPLIATVHHSHGLLVGLSTTLLDPTCTFDSGKLALEAWLREGAFEESWRFGLLAGGGGGQAGSGDGSAAGRMGLGRREWEECMAVEVRGWEEAFRIGAR